jgi:uncharacterized coiled-coil protein SlyX
MKKQVSLWALFSIAVIHAIGQNTNPWPSTGPVGIGTTSPRSNLEILNSIRVSSSATGSSFIFDGSGLTTGNNLSNVRLIAWNVDGGGYLQNKFDNYGGVFSWARGSASGDVEVMRIDATTGYVGIGTTAPGQKLHISAGNLQMDSGHEIYFGDNGQIRSMDDNHRILFRRADNKMELREFGNIVFSPGATVGLETAHVIMFNNGDVGIGTTTSEGYKLAVNGSAIFTSAKVKLRQNWPDYVFKKDYRLLSLAELEKFIQQNNHLPEIPSADEVAKEGLDLGSNQAALLKKIEELTLYIIEQNKTIALQQKEMQQMKTRIEAVENKVSKN